MSPQANNNEPDQLEKQSENKQQYDDLLDNIDFESDHGENDDHKDDSQNRQEE